MVHLYFLLSIQGTENIIFRSNFRNRDFAWLTRSGGPESLKYFMINISYQHCGAFLFSLTYIKKQKILFLCQIFKFEILLDWHDLRSRKREIFIWLISATNFEAHFYFPLSIQGKENIILRPDFRKWDFAGLTRSDYPESLKYFVININYQLCGAFLFSLAYLRYRKYYFYVEFLNLRFCWIDMIWGPGSLKYLYD